MKVFIVGGNTSYANWLENVEVVNSIEMANLVLFTGGEDVHPSLYNEPQGEYTVSNLFRDKLEKIDFQKAFELKKPMLGICRGAQFLCVMAGGKLVQHMENNNPYHKIRLNARTLAESSIFPELMMVSSDHHQLMFPYNLHESQFRLIGTAEQSRFHLNGKGIEMLEEFQPEPEIVYFKSINALCIQGHPEWMYPKKDMFVREFAVFNYLVSNLINHKF